MNGSGGDIIYVCFPITKHYYLTFMGITTASALKDRYIANRF